jgi:tetrapyrrole methylase family protein/MazG family protein
VSLDFTRVSALLARLPEDIRPPGGLQIIDLEAPFEPNPTVPTLIVGRRNGEDRAAALMTARRAFDADQPIWLLRAEGEATVSTVRALQAEEIDAIFVPAVEPEAAERSLAGLRHLVHRLRAPGGCPWDREQTHQSLAKYVLEEAYEVVDAIEHHGPEELSEELGDLLLQVFLQSELAEEAGRFSLNDVVERITTKLIRRHPHVFADVQVGGAADVEVNWEALKKTEKGDRVSALDGVPRSLPALTMAAELQKRMRKTGFEWPNRQGAEAKLTEELAELRDAPTPEAAAAELGDVLFVLTGLATWYGASAEEALRGTNAKVEARFRYVEDRVRERGLPISDVSLDELVALWNQAKTLDRPSA